MNMLKKKLNKKGFTLAELLIVVAIIAVLVAISIPIFTSQLEKSREATDMANIRAAYAELEAGLLTTEAAPTPIEVTVQQKTAGWASTPTWPKNLTVDPTTDSAKTKWTVSIDAGTGAVTATIS